MQLEITAEHSPHGCHWLVRHDHCRSWTWNGVPSPAHWLSDLAATGACCPAVRLALADDTFRADLGTVFERIIGDIRGRTTCALCWPDTSSRRQMAAARRLNRNAPRLGHEIPLYVPERAEPVGSVYVPRLGQFAPLDDAGVLAELDVLAAEIADLKAKEERVASRPPGKPPVSYATARERYMDTGTIACKEAMLEFVTMAEPDLDTIGRDWEPKPPARASTPRVTRYQATRALLAGAVLLAITTGVLPSLPLLTPIALTFLLLALVLSGKPKARK
jgi:hypothetical protein